MATSAAWTPEQLCCRISLVEFGEFANTDPSSFVDMPSWDRRLPYDSFRGEFRLRAVSSTHCATEFEDTNTAEMHVSKTNFPRTPPMLPLALTGEGECREAAASCGGVQLRRSCSDDGGDGSRHSDCSS